MYSAPSRSTTSFGARRGQELDTQVETLAGAVPEDLAGTLYRNGAGLRLDSYFADGEGLVSAVCFEPGRPPRVRSRYVDTPSYRATRVSRVQPLRLAGSNRPGGFVRNLGLTVANQANTNVVRVGESLLALWEAGEPYELDPQTLRTRGSTHFAGALHTAFSAHPCWDPNTRELYNFGISYGLRRTTLSTMKLTERGTLHYLRSVPLPKRYMVHACALTATYFVFCLSPLWFDALSIAAGRQAPFEALRWHPSEGTRILLVPRQKDHSEVRVIETEPWFQWHFAGAYDDGLDVVVDLVRFRSWPSLHKAMRTPGAFADPEHIPVGRLHRLRIDSRDRIELAPLHPLCVEWPTIDPRRTAQRHRMIYAAAQPSTVGGPWTAVAAYDTATQRLSLCDLGADGVVGEPLFAPRLGADPARDDDGYLVFYRTRRDADLTEVIVADAAQLDAGPRFRGLIPGSLGNTLHGSWAGLRAG